ncbi:MAG: 23S rRNA (guanosine(2251)-2'-O)-methyltransferase RlmB, partial [Chloroflexota bacterium]|nr:23S rRNA (guanosine(2251)-2'-O)-methyltransferase RlmB [Chloroflexota bacterium]
MAEALLGGRRRVRRLLVADRAHGLEPLLAEARRHKIAVDVLDRQRLDRLVNHGHHQGVLAEAEPFAYCRLEDMLAGPLAGPPLLLVLDSLQDPQNFGTLLRTAQATGVSGVVLPEHRAVGVTPAVSNASAGAIEHLPVARVTNLARSIEWLKAQGVWVHGLVVEAQQPFWDVDWTATSALVVGSEGAGLSRLVRARCDALITIPMASAAVQSLNAAVA